MASRACQQEGGYTQQDDPHEQGRIEGREGNEIVSAIIAKYTQLLTLLLSARQAAESLSPLVRGHTADTVEATKLGPSCRHRCAQPKHAGFSSSCHHNLGAPHGNGREVIHYGV